MSWTVDASLRTRCDEAGSQRSSCRCSADLLGGGAAFGFVGLVLGPIILVTAGTLINALTRRPHLVTPKGATED